MNWRRKLEEYLETYYQATGVAVSLLTEDGTQLAAFGEESPYCRLFKEGCGKYCPCQSSHLHACREADRLKDGYFFSCPGSYIHFAVPVYSNHSLRASVLAGPIALEYPDVDLIDSIVEKFGLDLSYRSKLYGAYPSVSLVDPNRARHLCKLLTALVSGVSSAEDNVFIRRHIAQDVQQAKIGDYIRLLKEDVPIFTSQYDQEKQLISDVLAGNQAHARSLLNEMLGRMYFSSGNNFEIIRTRAIELTALLSRAVVENSGDQAKVYQMTEDALNGITAARDLTGLSYTLLEILDVFIGMAFEEEKVPDSPGLQKAVAYMNTHYFERVTLEDVAEHVGLNPSYFSMVFKRQMQTSFSEYLTERRIRQAKVLLKNSNMPLVEVAIAVGFENQSYFSRVFKSCVGISPRQFRDRTD